MQLLDEIERYRSVAIVGLAKNAGKTECLNFILRNAAGSRKKFALTSIGVDGESRDQVTGTHKPEITLYPGMLFATSETHYRDKRLTAEIFDVSVRRTSLGRLVTARALDTGKVIISGPADTASLRSLIDRMAQLGARTTLVDGALSRLSLSSPAVTDAMVLATGAALSPNIDRIVRHTKYVYDLTGIEVTRRCDPAVLAGIDRGVFYIGGDGELVDTGIPSAYMGEADKGKLFGGGDTIFVAGAVSDKLLRMFAAQRNAGRLTLVMKDFTRMFAEPQTYYSYLRKGGRVEVARRSRLLAVSINPTSPQGYRVDPDALRRELQSKIAVPVIDVMRSETALND